MNRSSRLDASLMRHLFAATALASCCVAGAASAQASSLATTAAAAPAVAEANPGVVEELVVTARRQEEKLQDVPLAVSAVGEKTLRANNVVNVQSLNGLVPSLNYQFNGSRQGTGRVFFRGLTTGAGGQATRASIFLDGNYVAGAAQNVPFNYLERVEALPGPQSAQFGRATFGGAINYVTKEPTTTFSGVVHADYASYKDVTLDGFVSGPLFGTALDNRLTGSLFASYTSFDAPDEWKTPADVLHPDGVRQGSQRENYYAGKLKYEVTDDLTLRLGASYAEFDDAPYSFYLIPPGPLKNGMFQRYTANDPTRPIANSFLRYPVGSVAYLSDFIEQGGLGIAQNFYNIQDPNVHDFNRRVNGQVDWRVVGHDVTLNLFHEAETVKGVSFPDSDNTPFPSSSTRDAVSKIESNSAELRIASPTDQRLRYTVGAYWLKFTNEASSTSQLLFRCTDTVNGCVPTSAQAFFNPTIVGGVLQGYTGTAIAVNTRSSNASSAETTDTALFGMLSFDITEQFNATAELRYQNEHLISRNLISGFVGDTNNHAFVPRVTLNYKFTPQVMAYAVYSVGNNPGGFNPGVASFIGQGATSDMLSFKEEKLKNYELGIKSTLFDGRMVANFAMFQMDWIDQVSSTTLTATNGQLFAFNANHGTSRVRGGEAQVTIVPLEGLTLAGTASYNNARYVDYCSSSALNIIGYATPGHVGCFVVDGNYLENVPPWTMSLSADYRRELKDGWTGFVGGTYRYRSGQWAEDLNITQSGPQNLLDLRAGVESGQISVSVFCANCTNDLSPDRATNLADARLGSTTTLNRTVSGSLKKPRQFGIRTSYRF